MLTWTHKNEASCNVVGKVISESRLVDSTDLFRSVCLGHVACAVSQRHAYWISKGNETETTESHILVRIKVSSFVCKLRYATKKDIKSKHKQFFDGFNDARLHRADCAVHQVVFA